MVCENVDDSSNHRYIWKLIRNNLRSI
jgi:hypothetical protein